MNNWIFIFFKDTNWFHNSNVEDQTHYHLVWYENIAHINYCIYCKVVEILQEKKFNLKGPEYITSPKVHLKVPHVMFVFEQSIQKKKKNTKTYLSNCIISNK